MASMTRVAPLTSSPEQPFAGQASGVGDGSAPVGLGGEGRGYSPQVPGRVAMTTTSVLLEAVSMMVVVVGSACGGT